MTLNLSQTDVITRLRRWAGLAGKASPNATDNVQLVTTVSNLAVDPYQQEYDEFSAFISAGAVAADFSFAGITNGGVNPGAPLVVVDRIDYWTGTSMDITIWLGRQQSSSNGSTWLPANLSCLNQGFPKQAGVRNNSRVSQFVLTSPSNFGSIIFTDKAVPANTLRTFIPPYPIQLYQTNAAPGNAGDVCYVLGGTLDIGVFATFYWREWPIFRF